MICGHCGTENRTDRRFCLECGSPLARACPTCGSANEPNARFCGTCGSALADATAGAAAPAASRPASTHATQPVQPTQPLQPDSAALGTQRRLVSVLFADLVGFTPFAEERDPEEVRATLTTYGDLSREIVQRYGGTVEKFIGDAVMAVWGTPVAHEDDAERAVRAALELVDAVHVLGPSIQARAGILTGEAAVRVGATDQGIVAGDLVNTAARLQSVAAPGTVLVGEATMRAAEAAIAFERATDQELKGKSAPVAAYRATRVIAQRRGAGRSEKLETPFVGRDEEFRTLRELLHQAGRDPRARLVSVTGPAGIGKSRLAWELEKYIDGVVEPIYWHRGRCPAYGDGVTFWALGEMVRRRCGLAEAADESTTRAAVRATVAEYVPDESERDWIESALLSLLGIAPANEFPRELLFAAWRRFFENISALGTTVLVIEDLQWADPALLDFVDHVLDWSKGAPILILTLARPELFDRRPDWGAGRRTFSAIALEPLGPAAMGELLQGLVPDLPAAAVTAIAERADGIPLYAVEIVRMLLANGRLEQQGAAYRPVGELAEFPIPETLRSLISARLDSLDAGDRELVSDASVLGQTFGLEALAAVRGADRAALEPTLRRLVRREILTLEADPRAPERGQYSFVQGLIREVAYSTLSRPDRRRRHLAAARHYEAVASDELAGVLAEHYTSAHENSSPGPEAEAVAAQARVSLRAAAERAASLGGRTQAAAYLERAVAMTADGPEKASLQEQAAVQADLAGDYKHAESLARAAIEGYEAAADTASAGRANGILGAILIGQARVPDAVATLEAAAAALATADAPAELADVLAKLARAYYRNLEMAKSLQTVDRALVLAQEHDLEKTTAEALVTKGTALEMSFRPHEALPLMRWGLELGRRTGNLDAINRALANILGLVAAEEGPEATIALVDEGVELARTTGDIGMFVWHIGNLVWSNLFPGRPLAPAAARIEDALTLRLADTDRAGLEHDLALLRSLMGHDISAELAGSQSVGVFKDDPQLRTDALWLGAVESFRTRDFAASARTFHDLALISPRYQTWPLAAASMALTKNAEATRSTVTEMRAAPFGSQMDREIRRLAEALAPALEGRSSEALEIVRAALPAIRKRGVGFVAGVQAIALVSLMPADAELRELARESLAVFERMGARPFADLLSELLAREPGEGIPGVTAARATGVAMDHAATAAGAAGTS